MVKKVIVYNTKKETEERETEKKKKRERERERERTKGLKKYNSKRKEFSTLSQNIKACPRIFSV